MRAHPPPPPKSRPANGFNPWPWALWAFFSGLITLIVSFVIFANRNRMELVKPDYYENEIRYQTQIDRLNRSLPFSHEISVGLLSEGRGLRLEFPASHADRIQSGEVELYRPSHSALDRRLPLTPQHGASIDCPLDPLPPGLWRARVTWRVDGAEFFAERPLVVAAALPSNHLPIP